MNTYTNNKNKKIIVMVLVGAVMFFVGMKYGESQITNPTNQTTTRIGGMGGRGLRGGGGFVSGSILSIDTTGMTIKLTDGGSRIVFFGSSTPIMKSVSGTGADLVVGKNVMISGQANTDGSINAQSVQIRDILIK